jgi:hypothetical protein
MGQLESKLDDRERLSASHSSISPAQVPGLTPGYVSPPPGEIQQTELPIPLSPPSSPSSNTAPAGGSSPKRSPSRSLLSFLQTPEKRLIEAAKRGDDDEVSVLLADGANISTKTTLKKETPLHKAAQYGNLSTSLLLLLNGADPCALGKPNSIYIELSVCLALRRVLLQAIFRFLLTVFQIPSAILPVQVHFIAPVRTPLPPSSFQDCLPRAKCCDTTFSQRTARLYKSVQRGNWLF